MGVGLKHLSVIAVILMVFLTGCTIAPDSHWVFYSYQLDVYSENHTLQYQIFLPIPVNESNETQPGFLENMENVGGIFDTGINQTINGFSLEINGSGNVRFEIYFENESDDPLEPYSNMSMLNDYWPDEEIGFFWVFSSASNISIHLLFEYSSGTPDYEYVTLDYEIISILQIGWQRVPAVIRDYENTE